MTSELEEVMEENMVYSDVDPSLNMRVYLKKSLVSRKSLSDTTRRSFDVADIEDAFIQTVSPFVKEEECEIVTRIAIVKSAASRARTMRRDLDDFSVSESVRVTELIEQREQFPNHKILLTFGVKVDCEGI
ncbi:hypothetical protein V8E54_008556 [Elaphomyces granulatus]|jgi:hypothetical protein